MMFYFKRVNAQIFFLTFYIFGYSEQVIKTGLIVAKTGPTVSEVGMYTSVTAQ